MTDYDEPKEEERWCEECRAVAVRYFKETGVAHGEIGEWPACHLAPYISIWAIESKKAPGWVGWWAIAGDIPTDYISAETIKHPRDAMRRFGEHWEEIARYMAAGRKHPDTNIGKPEDWPKLGPLLQARSKLLLDWPAMMSCGKRMLSNHNHSLKLDGPDGPPT
jgi:hypothetical protein